MQESEAEKLFHTIFVIAGLAALNLK